ncbi:glycosyl transferase family 1 [Levilactobacillus yonginensis]|uniref:glycosyl transferase family 1 n=1 Tax=Levilactobacillus yonginensis TaxID=1054041 RepID=UPI000F7A69C1|nr:glycosyl transferase family 1 [Levilactobacillus yonginensis]
MKKSVIKQYQVAITNLGNVKDKVTGKVTLALSVSDRRHRAKVHFIRDSSFERVWNQVESILASAPQHAWVRIELVESVQRQKLISLKQNLNDMFRMNYWRRGVSFDPDFKTALLEMEINGHEFFKPSKQHKVGKNASESWIDFEQIKKYLQARTDSSVPNIEDTQYVWTFVTRGVFSDGAEIWSLREDESRGIGVRELTNPRQEINTYLQAGEKFLMRQIKDDGQFIYGYYPALQRVLTNYNSVRHFSSIYALLEAIDFTNRNEDIEKVKLALQWGIDHLTFTKGDALFAVEHNKKADDEVKLGAQAMLILALCKYQEVTSDDSFLTYAQQAFKGVTAFRQESGRFNHVLNVDLSVKDAFRIIYYEGEITFALARLFELTGDETVKQLIQETLDFMVANNYGQYHDHWISYAVNEALQIFSTNRDYMAMGLKNVFDHLDFIEKRDTSYPTLLELLNAAVKMTDTIKATGNDDLMEGYDLVRLRRVWRQRAEHEMATGTFEPELAMYFYYPEKFVGAFFARHDHFRTRIDDCEHFLSGLINYYNYKY